MVRSIGGTVSPDQFRDHLLLYQRHGTLISIGDAMTKLKLQEDFDRPYFAIWFDDGIKSVRRYALPILKEFGITAGYSVCSNFATKKEMYWCFKLSYLKYVDGLKSLRPRLRKHQLTATGNLLEEIIDNFSITLVEEVDAVYRKYTHQAFREAAMDIFDDADGVKILAREGWQIANHSASHYPLTASESMDFIRGEFEACSKFLKELDLDDDYLVIPFERGSNLATSDYYRPLLEDKILVRVGNRVNTAATFRDNVVYRFVPITDTKVNRSVPLKELNKPLPGFRLLRRIGQILSTGR